MKFKQTNQICSTLKINQSTLNKAYMIEKANAYIVAFMKARNFLFVRCREERINWEKKNTKDGENLFFKASANRFWLTSKCFSWFNKIVHGQPSIKGTS